MEDNTYIKIAQMVLGTMVEQVAELVKARVQTGAAISDERITEIIQSWWRALKESGELKEVIQLAVGSVMPEYEGTMQIARSAINDWWLEFRQTSEFREWVRAVQLPGISEVEINEIVRMKLKEIAEDL